MVKIHYGNKGRGGGGANRGQARKGAKATAGGGVADARFKIISKKRSTMGDARNVLAQLARGHDAREKLEKIRNLKQGKLDVKKTKSGAITITKTTSGKMLLTTKKKELAANKKKQSNDPALKNVRAAASAAAQSAKGITSKRRDNFTRNVGNSGTLSITTTKKGSALRPAGGVQKRSRLGNKPLVRTIRGELSDAARLDEELLNTHVSPVVLKRTIRQSVRDRSPETVRYVPTRALRDRSRSPIDADSYDRVRSRKAYNDFDDPRNFEEFDAYRSRIREADSFRSAPRTMADRLEAQNSSSSGAKVRVSNLQPSVSQDDIIELFGDVGKLKRARLVDHGVAEVVFVDRMDAQKAVEIYHNRQLDGKAMKCQILSAGYEVAASSNASRFAASERSSARPEHYLQPEMSSIHKALFNDKGKGASAGSKPMFTVTMKSGR